MSNATIIPNPFPVQCIGGPADGERVPQATEPSFGDKLRIQYLHDAFSAQDGTTTHKHERRIYTYRYTGNGQAIPIES